MAETPQPKQGSLWARIMGVADDPAPPALPGAIVPSDDPDDAVSFDSPADADDPSPTIKLANVMPPIPEFAKNPLEPELVALPAARRIPMATPIARPVEANAMHAAPITAVPIVSAPCPSCGTPRKPGHLFCDDCGYHFSPAATIPLATPIAVAAAGAIPAAAVASIRLKDRYLLGAVIGEKLGVKRYRALDASVEPSVPVVIVAAQFDDEPAPVATPVEDELLPTFDAVPEASVAETVPLEEIQTLLEWPRPSWERHLLERVKHPALPAVVDSFIADTTEYLVLEAAQGQTLWDAWDDPDSDAATRYGMLKQIAQAMDVVHKAGAIFECLSPDHFVVDEHGQVRCTDIADLLPLPFPVDAPLRGTHYTAPEFIGAPHEVDARAGLYSLGAILYSLEYLHHGLEDGDFESQYTAKQVTERFPDVHPLFPRVINKTFVKDPRARFPSDEAAKIDASGFDELQKTLTVCQRAFDSVRLDIAAWTTTGMVRTGNEDALAFLHGVDTRQDELHEYALILLCDGMGGYDAGEVAAAIAIAEMKTFFLQQPMFAGLAGKDAFPGPIDVEATKKLFDAGLKHANKEVFAASRTPGKGKRGMGCTAEAVYVDAQHVVVGHVGDSRVYHLKNGRLQQLTRDQTLVNRLVELGQIKAEDAENHPRKNELQQAVGGQPDVYPGVYHSRLKRGDWVVVCSDGLSNHISHQELEKMLTREASTSAEEAARRLLNLVNLRGATDNATIVVIRAN